MKVSLSYDHWSLRKWRKKSGNFWTFLRKNSHCSWALSESFRPARFFKLRKREISDKFKSFCLFSVDKPHQTGQTHASADVSGPLISVAEGFIAWGRWKIAFEIGIFLCVFAKKLLRVFWHSYLYMLVPFSDKPLLRSYPNYPKNYYHWLLFWQCKISTGIFYGRDFLSFGWIFRFLYGFRWFC